MDSVTISEVVERLIQDGSLEEHAHMYLLACEGPRKWKDEARQSFTQMIEVLAKRAEMRIAEERNEKVRAV